MPIALPEGGSNAHSCVHSPRLMSTATPFCRDKSLLTLPEPSPPSFIQRNLNTALANSIILCQPNWSSQSIINLEFNLDLVGLLNHTHGCALRWDPTLHKMKKTSSKVKLYIMPYSFPKSEREYKELQFIYVAFRQKPKKKTETRHAVCT